MIGQKCFYKRVIWGSVWSSLFVKLGNICRRQKKIRICETKGGRRGRQPTTEFGSLALPNKGQTWVSWVLQTGFWDDRRKVLNSRREYWKGFGRGFHLLGRLLRTLCVHNSFSRYRHVASLFVKGAPTLPRYDLRGVSLFFAPFFQRWKIESCTFSKTRVAELEWWS